MSNPMRHKSINDIYDYFTNGGLIIGLDSFDFAKEYDLFKYIGYSNGHHRYLIGFEDEENEGNVYVSMVFVNLGSNGHICADFGGCPIFETTNLDDLIAYVEKRCN